jgi:diguanylate cyclase (GGDEF)-like protein
VDDFGAGFTNLRMLVELGPDFVKIDRSLADGAARHPRKRAFLESMATLGHRLNCAVIGEGVETPEDLAALRACGIAYAQGYALGAPAPIADVLDAQPVQPPARLTLPTVEETIGSLAVPQDGVPASTPVGLLFAHFAQQPEPAAIPVLEGTRVVGLVTVGLMFLHLGHRYGHSLWHDRPVEEFVHLESSGHDCLTADASLEDATEVVRRRPTRRRFDPIVVVTNRGDYHGLLPVDLLLGEMTRLKVDYALHANPLTGLPGSLALSRVADMRLAAGQHFTLGWVDIDYFKPFNDRYGFDRGDRVLLLLAEILRRHLGSRPDDFLAHPGGDDFAFLALPSDAERRAWEATAEFDQRIGDMYDQAEREARGFVCADRQGQERWHGFLSVSIGLVPWRGEPDIDLRRLVEIAAEVKAAAKACTGSAVVTNSRALSPGGRSAQ